MSTSSTPAPAAPRSSRSRWLVGLLLTAVLGVGATVAGVALTRDDDEPRATSAGEISEVQASCRDWMSAAPRETQPDAQWCADMFTWMNAQPGGSMMGSRMWQGPEEMASTCSAWVTEGRAADATAAQQRCEQMVEWLDGDMSSRGGRWMRQDR